MSYVDHKSESEVEKALTCCRGSFQRNIIHGAESLSLATLKGTARSYGGRYRRSVDNLLARMSAAGVEWHEERQDHGRRVLVIG